MERKYLRTPSAPSDDLLRLSGLRDVRRLSARRGWLRPDSSNPDDHACRFDWRHGTRRLRSTFCRIRRPDATSPQDPLRHYRIRSTRIRITAYLDCLAGTRPYDPLLLLHSPRSARRLDAARTSLGSEENVP